MATGLWLNSKSTFMTSKQNSTEFRIAQFDS